jgi:hypothetical protein
LQSERPGDSVVHGLRVEVVLRVIAEFLDREFRGLRYRRDPRKSFA